MIFRRKYDYHLYHDDYEFDGLPDPSRVHFWHAKDKDSMPAKERRQPAQPVSKFDGRPGNECARAAQRARALRERPLVPSGLCLVFGECVSRYGDEGIVAAVQ